MVKSSFERVPSLNISSIEIAGALQANIETIKARGDFVLDMQQEAALEAIGGAMVNGKTSGYIEMATSTGKTTIEAVLAEAAVRAGKRVLILAPTLAIAEQISGKNGENPKGLGKFTDLHETTDVRHHYGHRKGTKDANVVISTYAGFRNDFQNDHEKLGEFDIIIADECHRSLGIETSKALTESFPNAFKLGLSATPDFAADRKSDEVYKEQLFEFSLIDAVESGKTSTVRTLLYETDQTLELNEPGRDFTERELAPLIRNIERNGVAQSLIKDLVKDGRQGIVSCVPGSSNLHARMMAQYLSHNEGVVAADVGAHLTQAEQAARLKMFEAGEIDVLTFSKALEEGWDSANASFCLNLAPTASPVRTKQLLGRILRQNPDGRESIYIDFVDKRDGVNKNQYTALHALGLEYVDMTRILGRSNSKMDNVPKLSIPLPAISKSLYQKLLRSQGKLLSEIQVQKSDILRDPLVMHWERVLEKEGLPSELPENIALNTRVEKAYGVAQRRLYRKEQIEPTHEEILKELEKDLSSVLLRTLGEYGIQLYSDDHMDILEAIPSKSASSHDEVIYSLLQEQLKAVFDMLSERETGVVMGTYGIMTPDGEPLTLDELGRQYGVTKERIRQIESKTMSKLRNPYRSGVLRDYAEDNVVEPHSKKVLRENIATSALLLNLANIQRFSKRESNGLTNSEALMSEYRMQKQSEEFYSNLIDKFVKNISKYSIDSVNQTTDRVLIKQIFGIPTATDYKGDVSLTENVWKKDDPWCTVAVQLRSRISSGASHQIPAKLKPLAITLLDQLISQAR